MIPFSRTFEIPFLAYDHTGFASRTELIDAGIPSTIFAPIF